MAFNCALLKSSVIKSNKYLLVSIINLHIAAFFVCIVAKNFGSDISMKLLFNRTESYKSLPIDGICLQADKFAAMFVFDPHAVLHHPRRKVQDKNSLQFLVRATSLLIIQILSILLVDNKT